MKNFLKKNFSSIIPQWLADYRPGEELDLMAVKRTESVFYPGSGNDGFYPLKAPGVLGGMYREKRQLFSK